VFDEHVELLERALVEQQFDALARGQLAALVLGLDAALAAAQPRLVPAAAPACPRMSFISPALHQPAAKCIPRGRAAFFPSPLGEREEGTPIAPALTARLGIPAKGLLTTAPCPNPPPPRNSSSRACSTTARATWWRPWRATSRCCAPTRRTPTRSITSRWSPARRGNTGRASISPAAPSTSGRRRPRVHNLLARRLYREGERLEALKNFDRAHRARTPSFADAHGNRANIPGRRRLCRRGAEELRPRARAQSGSGPDWLNRGALLQELGRHDEALANSTRRLCAARMSPSARQSRQRAQGPRPSRRRRRPSGAAALRRGDGGLRQGDRTRAAARRELSRPRPAQAAARRLAGPALPITNTARKAGEPTFAPLPDPRWDGALREGERLVLVNEQGLATPSSSAASRPCWRRAAST